MATGRGKESRPQVNIAVDSRTLLALRAMAARDQISLSDVLRPVIERYVQGRLKRDQDLALAIDHLSTSRLRDRNEVARHREGAEPAVLRLEDKARGQGRRH